MRQRFGSRFPCSLKIKLKAHSYPSCNCHLKNIGLGGACITTECTNIQLNSCHVGDYVEAEVVCKALNEYANFHSKAEIIYVEPGLLGITWTEQQNEAYEPLNRLVQHLSQTKLHA